MKTKQLKTWQSILTFEDTTTTLREEQARSTRYQLMGISYQGLLQYWRIWRKTENLIELPAPPT